MVLRLLLFFPGSSDFYQVNEAVSHHIGLMNIQAMRISTLALFVIDCSQLG